MTKRIMASVLTCSCFAAAALSSAPASAGEKKAYSSGFCKPTTPKAYSSYVHYYRAEEFQQVICPIIRDQTEATRLPEIRVEVNQASVSDASNLSCVVWWIDEDSASGTIRGWSNGIAATAVGVRQLSFDSLSDYEGGSGMSLSLSSGGEGSMGLRCMLEQNDVIYQYFVDEDIYG